MKILICGADGQLGTELSRILGSGKAEIGEMPQEYRDAQVVCTDASKLDITNREVIFSALEKEQFDLIVNCAAMTNVDACEENEETAYQVNALGARNLAEAAQKTGAKLVHISTDYVFSGDENSDYVETDTPNPKSAYGRTKLAGEKYVIESCKKSFIVRTAWLYGYHGSNFVKTILSIARKNGTIKVVNDQYGNPTSANDLAYEILQIALTKDYGIYHCTNKGLCSWFDFASEIVDIAGIDCDKTPCTTDDFPRPAQRPAYSGLRNKRLEDTIGDEMRDWKVALTQYLHCLPRLDG